MNTGSIIAVRGIVVDIKFHGELPKIYDAVEVQSNNANDQKVVIEVLQQLDGGIVRGIAMTATDGLKR
jgi:F-type H+-transporting ATPase subunit beta